MAVNATASDQMREVSAPPTNAEPVSPVSRAAIGRAFGVTYGPSVLLNLFVVASIATLIAERLGGRTSCPLLRTLRPLAGLGVATAAAYLVAGRRRLRRWGATHDEVHRALPGDELVPEPWIEATWAVTIDAPVEAVWPWLAQVGQDRGGFYSYEWLENLAGCEMRNADRIHAEWQRRAVGETIRLHPAYGLKVTRFEPNRALVMDGWGAFVIEPINGCRTRLISRSRVPHGWAALAYALLLEIPHFVMQRKMLLGIKERAERAARETGATRRPEPLTVDLQAREAPAPGGFQRTVTIVDTSRCPRQAATRVERRAPTPVPQPMATPTVAAGLSPSTGPRRSRPSPPVILCTMMSRIR